MTYVHSREEENLHGQGHHCVKTNDSNNEQSTHLVVGLARSQAQVTEVTEVKTYRCEDRIYILHSMSIVSQAHDDEQRGHPQEKPRAAGPYTDEDPAEDTDGYQTQ